MKPSLIPFLLLASYAAISQPAQLNGHIYGNGEPLEYATIILEGTTFGTVSDKAGQFELTGVPAGSYRLVASMVGYQRLSRKIGLAPGESLNLRQLELFPDVFGLEEIVVTGSRTDRNRRGLPVQVDIITAETFEASQSLCLAEGLNYQPGLRTETDCQTCNYTQVRMNGLGGGYSQILLNSRPIFSALNGLYGLEQIPSNMIERVEVVRGGGSALFGSSAIAGTINIITKDPKEDGFALAINHALIEGAAHDNMLNFNLTEVSETAKAGLTFFASRRQRQEYDANGDGFSEMPRLMNYSLGAKAFFEPSERERLGLSLNSIFEERNGGDQLDQPPHQRSQSEQRSTHIFAGNIDYRLNFSNNSQLAAYGGAQRTSRNHYTGLYGQDGYGTTDNYTVQGGVQYDHTLPHFAGGRNTLTAGSEYQLEDVFDEIPAYGYQIDQTSRQWGFFLQSDWAVSARLSLLLGARLNLHNFVDRPVATPRLSILYTPFPDFRLRASYARGFRAPQAFDTDLHIAFAGGGIATIQIDPGLQPEYSDSYSASLDYDRPGNHLIYGFTLSAFHTRLTDVFVLEEATTDNAGNRILEKRNGSTSTVAGITLEGRANFDNWVEFSAGLTLQESTYAEPVAWSAEIRPSRQYLRTPNQYGFYSLSFLNEKDVSFFLTGVYTGPMLVPHFGGAPGVDGDRLEVSPHFLEANLKVSYQLALPRLGQGLEFSAGIQNLTNAYQADFDRGAERDSNYIYGPARPRTFFLGLKWRNG